MPQNANTNSLYTVVRNISGKTRRFGFLGPHGKTLAPNETYEIPGDLFTSTGKRTGNRRFKALVAALDTHQTLEVVSTPAPLLYDATSDRTRQLALDNGVLGVIDPSWSSEGSSEFSQA